MFFDDAGMIPQIASKCGTAIFVVPESVPVEIKNALVLQPEGKSVITIEQVQQMLERLTVRQTVDTYVVIRPAELLNIEAANALLKSLEEPSDRVHFVLITDKPSLIIPTIMSRAAVYFLRVSEGGGVAAEAKIKDLAKRLMVARGSELVALAEEIAKKKEGVRAYALEVIGAAIEMLYKTYYLNGKQVFLNKLPRFLAAYEGISKNGNVKLQIVANLA